MSKSIDNKALHSRLEKLTEQATVVCGLSGILASALSFDDEEMPDHVRAQLTGDYAKGVLVNAIEQLSSAMVSGLESLQARVGGGAA